MKYIKNISELKSSTYKAAADALKRKGHIKRVSSLEDWSGKIREKELEAVKKEMIDRIKSIGKFQIYIADDILFDFYIYFSFDEKRFESRYVDWIQGNNESLYITLDIGVIPVLEDEESKDTFYRSYFYKNRYGKNTNNEYYSSVGLTWIGEIEIHLGYMPDGTDFFPMGIDHTDLYQIWSNDNFDERIPQPTNPQSSIYKDRWGNIDWSLPNRKEAFKFRKAIIDIFKGNVIYDKSSKNTGGLKSKVMNFLVPDYIDFEYFIEWVDSLNRININRLYKD